MKIGRFIVGASYAAALLWYDDDDMSLGVVGSGRGGGVRSGGGCGEEAGEAVSEDAAAVATAGTVPAVDLASAPSSCGTTAAVVAMESTVILFRCGYPLRHLASRVGFWKGERNVSCFPDVSNCLLSILSPTSYVTS
jgi:hypothetical protein